MLKAIIIDDEIKSRQTLKSLLAIYCPDVIVIGEADGYKSGLDLLKIAKTDIVFLDIQMPDGSGFKLLEDCEEISFHVIFTTAYDHYAIKAIRFSALDYLLKPIDPEELIGAVQKSLKTINADKQQPNINTLIENFKHQKSGPKKIVLSTSEGLHIIDVNTIIRCESDDYYTRFFFTNSKSIMVSRTLKENEELLSESNFIRTHKSHLVNLDFIKTFVKTDGGYILLTNGDRVPVSRRKKEKILEIIFNL